MARGIQTGGREESADGAGTGRGSGYGLSPQVGDGERRLPQARRPLSVPSPHDVPIFKDGGFRAGGVLFLKISGEEAGRARGEVAAQSRLYDAGEVSRGRAGKVSD